MGESTNPRSTLRFDRHRLEFHGATIDAGLLACREDQCWDTEEQCWGVKDQYFGLHWVSLHVVSPCRGVGCGRSPEGTRTRTHEITSESSTRPSRTSMSTWRSGESSTQYGCRATKYCNTPLACIPAIKSLCSLHSLRVNLSTLLALPLSLKPWRRGPLRPRGSRPAPSPVSSLSTQAMTCRQV